MKGLITAPLEKLLDEGGYDCVYVCGPSPMMRAVTKVVEPRAIPCQISLENIWAAALVRAFPARAVESANGSRSARTALSFGHRRCRNGKQQDPS